MNNNRVTTLLPVAVLLLMAACAWTDHQPQPLDPARTQTEIRERSLEAQDFREYVRDLTDEASAGQDRPWNLQMLTLAAFYHNPGMRVAYEQLRLSRARVQTASQRINPRLNMPLEYQTDTHADSSHMVLGWLLDFVYERKAKRQARINQARASLEASRHHIREVAWDIRTNLHSACLDYFSTLESKRLAEMRHELLKQKLALLRQRYEAGQIGRTAVDGTEIETQRARLDLANLETEVDNRYHRLIGMTGLQADDFSNVDLEFEAFNDLSQLLSMDEADFREDALQERADIRRTLAEYNALEQALRLEIEKQFPDITLSPGFVFDQDDKIWALGSSWMLPLYHNNDGPIAEALAERSVMQARFMELQSSIINSLDAATERFRSLKSSLELARSIHNKAIQKNKAINNQFEHGYSDRLQVIDAELSLIESRRSLLSSKVRFLEAAIRLESITQTPLHTNVDIEQSLDLLYSLNEPPAGDA